MRSSRTRSRKSCKPGTTEPVVHVRTYQSDARRIGALAKKLGLPSRILMSRATDLLEEDAKSGKPAQLKNESLELEKRRAEIERIRREL